MSRRTLIGRPGRLTSGRTEWYALATGAPLTSRNRSYTSPSSEQSRSFRAQRIEGRHSRTKPESRGSGIYIGCIKVGLEQLIAAKGASSCEQQRRRRLHSEPRGGRPQSGGRYGARLIGWRYRLVAGVRPPKVVGLRSAASPRAVFITSRPLPPRACAPTETARYHLDHLPRRVSPIPCPPPPPSPDDCEIGG